MTDREIPELLGKAQALIREALADPALRRGLVAQAALTDDEGNAKGAASLSIAVGLDPCSIGYAVSVKARPGNPSQTVRTGGIVTPGQDDLPGLADRLPTVAEIGRAVREERKRLDGEFATSTMPEEASE